jgi:hypothetical protein
MNPASFLAPVCTPFISVNKEMKGALLVDSLVRRTLENNI